MRKLDRTGFIYVVVSSVATLVIVLVVWLIFFRTNSLLPSGIEKQLQFTPFVVTPNSDINVAGGSYSYDPTNQVLRYTVSSNKTGKLTVSEQTTPPQFIDIEDYSSKLIDSLNRYSAFDNEFGTVYLTRPKTIQSGQIAILNADGVLLFVQSYKDLSDAQWRQVFQHLRLDQ